MTLHQEAGRSQTLAAGAGRRIVLFGMPDAGKSSLLGALAQAAQVQEHILKARLIDKSQGLVELQRRLYEERPRETLEEVVPYSVALEPLCDKDSAAQPSLEVTLIDCDGRVANQILARPKALDGTADASALADAIRNADTLVLVVDGSADQGALKLAFAQFTRFLRLLEESRGRRSDIGGLPVYLVLTKCDLLVQKDDTSHVWMDRIEDRKREVHTRFKEFLAEQAAHEPLPFGKIDLHVWATAVKRPALVDSPAKPREPYGVAELFRQCFASAVHFRERRVWANRRLTWTVATLAGLLAIMLLFVLVLIVSQPSAELSALADQVRQFRSAYPPDRPAERLKGPVDDKIQKLETFRSSPVFNRLDPDLRDYVGKTLTELTAYRSYADQLKDISDGFNGDLNKVKSEEQLASIKKELEKLTVPQQFKTEWSDVRPVQRRQRWLEQIAIIEKEADRLGNDFQKLVDEGKKVLAMKDILTIVELRERVKVVLDRARKLPDKSDLLPGAEELSYEMVFRLERVASIRSQWEPELHNNLRDLAKLLKAP